MIRAHLTERVMGLPAWGWAALAAVVMVAATLERRPSNANANVKSDSAQSDPRVPPLIAIATPQETTPYNLPVTRSGVIAASVVTGGMRP